MQNQTITRIKISLSGESFSMFKISSLTLHRDLCLTTNVLRVNSSCNVLNYKKPYRFYFVLFQLIDDKDLASAQSKM